MKHTLKMTIIKLKNMLIAYKKIVIMGTIVIVFTTGAIIGFIVMNEPADTPTEIDTKQADTTTTTSKTENKDDKKEKDTTENKDAATDKKETTSNETDSTEKSTPKTASHNHTWVNHEIQVPHEEQYVVREWDEEVYAGTKANYDTYYVCSVCGDELISSDWFEDHKHRNHQDYVDQYGADAITYTPTKFKVSEFPVYNTEHKVEYGTRTTYTTEVDYIYCSECGEHK